MTCVLSCNGHGESCDCTVTLLPATLPVPADDRLSEEEIVEGLRLADAATPGPWEAASDWPRAAVYSRAEFVEHGHHKRVVCSGNQNNERHFEAASWSGCDPGDARFIAASRRLLPLALRSLAAERARASALARDNAELRAAVVEWRQAEEAFLSSPSQHTCTFRGLEATRTAPGPCPPCETRRRRGTACATLYAVAGALARAAHAAATEQGAGGGE